MPTAQQANPPAIDFIKAVLAYAAGYHFKALKKTEGREGPGWIGTLYRGAKKLGDCADYGNGASVHLGIRDREELKLLHEHAVAINRSDYDFEEEGTFLENLYNYTESVKRIERQSKTKIIFCDPTCPLDENGIPSSMKILSLRAGFQPGPAAYGQLRSRHPDAVILNESLDLWRTRFDAPGEEPHQIDRPRN